ncbi:MAG: efflux RND transporter periplasmic adaptor subunit, partial [Gammaproteobacteria bacterium]
SDSLRVGGSFETGEVLFSIDPRDYELALAQAKASLAGAEARLKLRQAESDAAPENYALLHGDAPVPDLVAKVPQIEQSRADVASATARVARAELDLSRTQFSLPFSGHIAASSISPGQLLTPGQNYGEVFADDAIEVTVPVADADLAALDPIVGRSAEVRSGGQTFSATVERRSAVLDERTRFARLYLKLSGDPDLPPGAFVDVTLKGAEFADSFVIPEAAQQAQGNVWVVSNGSLTMIEPTVLGRQRDGLVVAPFDYGEGVVLGSIPGGSEGSRVATERGGTTSIPGG